MRKLITSLVLFSLPLFMLAQFAPTEKGLTIIVTDGTDEGRASAPQPPSSFAFQDTIRPLGMSAAIQAGAFIDRPQYGMAGFLLVFCVNDTIGGEQGIMQVDGKIIYGVYRLIRQKMSVEEEIPEGMTSFKLSGTVYFLGVSG